MCVENHIFFCVCADVSRCKSAANFNLGRVSLAVLFRVVSRFLARLFSRMIHPLIKLENSFNPLLFKAIHHPGSWGRKLVNRRFPEITGKNNLTVFSYSGRVKSPEWRRHLRRADLRQF